jgi:CHAT domain-containing protein
VLGPEHPDVANSLQNLSALFWMAGDVPRAREHLARAIATRERHLVRILATLPEPRKRRFLRTASMEANMAVSFHIDGASGDLDALALALRTTLQRKGRVLDEVAHAQAALRRNLAPTLQAELDELQEQRAKLATLRLAPPDPRHAEPIRALVSDVERRELDLSRQSAAFRAQLEPVTIEAVQATLPKDAALIEFVRYRRFDLKNRPHWREARYLAYALRPEGPPQWVALGEAALIKAAVTLALEALATGDDDVRGPLRALDELVFAPLRRLLGPVDHWLLSPDGDLNRVPFAALVDEEGRYLLERALITYLTSGRDRVRATARGAPRARAIVVAAPDYQGSVPALPGTQAEADAISEHFPEAEVFVGLAATGHVLTKAKGPLFVHLATHGFFGVSDTVEVRNATRRNAYSWRDNRDLVSFEASSAPPSEGGAPIAFEAVSPPPEEGIDLEDALDTAGLVLARAEGSDSVLTAREIAGLDLDGTQLVVLSACETGVGRIAAGEGVYGLRRALAIAGAETQVVSLWKVDDDATAALMGRYYDGLRARGGRAEALRQAQLAMLRGEWAAEGYDYAHPFYWAAFVPIGDEGPLRRTPTDA